MASKLSVDAFLRVIAQSGLLTSEKLSEAMDGLQQAGVDVSSADAIADAFVEREILTRWQADKLLQGKHKGFFLGKYRLLSLLGKGGMSSVYLAEHVLMRRRCAIKVLPAKRVHDTSYLGRFHREAQAVAALDHPNIVRAYDVDQEVNKNAEIHFLVMEYVEGNSLQELVRDKGVLSYDDAVEYCRQTALGLEHAHAAGMVHRDVKPGNLLVDQNGVVKILDLGLARFFGEGETESLTVAHDEKVLGTADYLAPEQALDSHQVDSRADIYSLGCTLYFMLTGHPPFTDGTLAQRLMSHQRKEPAPISDERPDFPESLDQILRKMMKKEPSERYETAQEVADAFANWLNEYASDSWKSQHPGATSGKVPVAASEQPEPEDQNLANFLANLSREDSSMLDRTSPSSKTGIKDAGDSTARKKPDSSADGLKPRVAKPVQAKPVSRKKVSPKKPAAAVETAAKTVPKKKATQPGSESPSDSSTSDTDPPSETTDTKLDSNRRRAKDGAASAQTTGATARSRTGGSSRIRSAASSGTIDSRVGIGNEAEDAQGSGSLVTGSHTKKLSESFISRIDQKKLVIPAAAIALLLVALLLAYFLWPPSDSANNSRNEKIENEVVENPFDPAEPMPRDVTVGAEGDFKSLSAAIAIAKTSFESAGPSDVLTITVLPGTYNDRIVLDYSGNVSLNNVRIVARDAGTAILKPDGDEPVIHISRGRRIVIDGLKIEAEDKPVAVALQGTLEGLRLRNLEITGFTDHGILTDSLSGHHGDSRDVRLTELKIHCEKPFASGITLQVTDIFTTLVRIQQSMFFGEMQAGIVVAGDSDGLEIDRSIFAGLKRGIAFEGEIEKMWDMRVANNTFYKTETPVYFKQMPYPINNKLNLFRNLFIKPTGDELLVDAGLAPEEMRGILFVGNNWSDRPKSGESPAANKVDIFANKGKQGALGITFLSTNPAEPDFLKPKMSPTLILRSVAGEPRGLPPYIGALDPRPPRPPNPNPPANNPAANRPQPAGKSQ